jgi:ketosteroid isomerase-like protein
MRRLIAVMSFVTGMIFLSGLPMNAYAHVQLPPAEVIKADKQDVTDIVAVYGKIEEALAKEDIDAIMTFYADDYFHQGITKSQIRNLWVNIFANFDSLNSTHVFNSVKVLENEAAVTCTGSLLGIPKGSKDKAYVSVDKWDNMKHYLSKKSGSWMIVGGASHWQVEPILKYGEDVKYQLEFHPLF